MRWLVPASLWMCLTTLRGITHILQPIAAFTSLALTKALMWMHTYKPCLHSIDERHGFQSNREQYYTEPLLTTTSALVFGSFIGTLNIQRLGFCNKEFVIRSKNRVFVSKKMTKMELKWCHLLYIMVPLVRFHWLIQRAQHKGRSHGDCVNSSILARAVEIDEQQQDLCRQSTQQMKILAHWKWWQASRQIIYWSSSCPLVFL